MTFLPILMTCAAFLIDLDTPNGLLDGFLYVAAVLVCVWVPAVHVALYTALGLMLPMILGFALSPNGVALSMAVANRCVAMGTIWLAAIAVWRNAQSARESESTLTVFATAIAGGARCRLPGADCIVRLAASRNRRGISDGRLAIEPSCAPRPSWSGIEERSAAATPRDPASESVGVRQGDPVKRWDLKIQKAIDRWFL